MGKGGKKKKRAYLLEKDIWIWASVPGVSVSFQKVYNWMVHGFCVAFYFFNSLSTMVPICIFQLFSLFLPTYFISLGFFLLMLFYCLFLFIFMFGPLYLLHVSSRLLYHSPPAHIYPLCFFFSHIFFLNLFSRDKGRIIQPSYGMLSGALAIFISHHTGFNRRLGLRVL